MAGCGNLWTLLDLFVPWCEARSEPRPPRKPERRFWEFGRRKGVSFCEVKNPGVRCVLEGGGPVKNVGIWCACQLWWRASVTAFLCWIRCLTA